MIMMGREDVAKLQIIQIKLKSHHENPVEKRGELLVIIISWQ